MRVGIYSIETTALHDEYISSSESWTALWIDALTRSVKISQEFDPRPGKELFWHGFDILRRLENRPSEEITRQYLNGEKAQMLLDRICNGHKKWPYGNDAVPELNEDARAALDVLLYHLEHLTDNEP